MGQNLRVRRQLLSKDRVGQGCAVESVLPDVVDLLSDLRKAGVMGGKE